MPTLSILFNLLAMALLCFFLLRRRSRKESSNSKKQISPKLIEDFKAGNEEARLTLFKIHFERLQIFLIILERKGITSKRAFSEYRVIAMLALEELWDHRNAIKNEKDIDEMLFHYVIRLLVKM